MCRLRRINFRELIKPMFLHLVAVAYLSGTAPLAVASRMQPKLRGAPLSGAFFKKHLTKIVFQTPRHPN